MEIFIILGVLLFLAALSFFVRGHRALSVLNSCGHLLMLLCAVKLAWKVCSCGSALRIANIFYIDALSAFFIVIISVVNMAVALYSSGYIADDLKEGVISQRKSKAYYALFNLFALTMFLVTVLDNLGFVWVAVEMTTLVSAFLVGFYNTRQSVEAAWKYIIICSVGITLALLGTILFYYSASSQAGVNNLNWTNILAVAKQLDPKIVKLAFLFILVGYGTKAGIAPMHTWLPDAHSQAPAPISALLSGVLLKTAVYVIMRFTVIINTCLGSSQYTGNLFIFFGLLSLGLSAAFILVQRDLKRLLAYSSIEHIGIITFSLGLGAPAALYGCLLHILNHAVTKTLMFFSAGRIVKAYKTHSMGLMHGVIKTLPFVGIFALLGIFALAGSVPFSIFISELIILIAAFMKGAYLSAGLFILFIAIIFAGLISHFSKILFGKPAEAEKENSLREVENFSAKLSFVFLSVFIIILGIFIPGFLSKLLVSAAAVIRGA